MRYAVIDSLNRVVNVILIDDPAQWIYPEQIVLLAENEPCSIGNVFDGNASPRFTED